MSDQDATQDEAPTAPPVPSFDSLRDPRRRSAIDLLVPTQDAPPSRPEPVAAPAPRPPDYADLVRLGVHLARLSLGVPVRLARRVRRLLGG